MAEWCFYFILARDFWILFRLTVLCGLFFFLFSAPQKPTNSKNKSDSEDEKKIILCSASDTFVLSQDVCAKCGALGTDQEGCLIACVQCGQCYHPYCINIKVI